MGIAETAFVGDCILWDGNKHRLSARVGQLIDELALWGLKVNAEKSQVYHSPFSSDQGSVQVGEHMVEPDDRLDVRGIPFKVGIVPKDALQPLFARTKGKFWAIKHLLRAKTPLKGRLQLLQRVLGGTALWCAGAIHPDKQALKSMNMLQSQLVMWTMRICKHSQETWVQFRVRCLRSARNAIHQHMGYRWSTLWLRRVWDYSGHRARASSWDVIPGCAVLNEYRTLQWWHHQQGLHNGTRHTHRFFPRLMGEERALNRAAKGDWRTVAMDRHRWCQLQNAWVDQEDVQWSSLEQLALDM